jgi:endonuclease YncB( thermonuclease family)
MPNNLHKAKPPYDLLLSQVKNTLIQGQQRIEEEKVRTYWQTGQHIHQHILKHSDRAEYGRQVVVRLVEDLKVDKTTLHDCVNFAKAYPVFPIVRGRVQFKWTHFRALVRMPDEKVRKRFDLEAQRNAWTADELIARIKAEKVVTAATFAEPIPAKAISHDLLKPLRGELYYYRIIRRPDVSTDQDTGLRIDLGFHNFEKLLAQTAAQFAEGDIVTSVPKDGGGYRFTKVPNAGESALFTYEAKVEKVVDGDTFKVRFDQGFGFERTETLRLRGLDCPELSTKQGAAAKIFVQSYIKEAAQIIVRSSRDDKYGRYLADIYLPSREDGGEDVYLNNLLLEKGFAVRM